MNENPIVYSATLSTITRTYNASLAVSSRTYSANVATVINATIVDIPQYEGPYSVDPLARADIVLETKEKLCTDDIVVNKIRKFETINPAGGYTLYIAEME